MKIKLILVMSSMGLVLGSVFCRAASQGTVHVAVYSSDFVVDTDRQIAIGPQAKRVAVTTHATGSAAGAIPISQIEIYRLSLGKLWTLDPKTMTYASQSFVDSSTGNNPSAASNTSGPVTLVVSKIEPTVTGPLGSDTINGFPAKSYTIRLVVSFSNPQNNQPVATEMLLEKLWVTDKAPAVQKFRQDESDFSDALYAVHGTEKADLAWILRTFNQYILSMAGNTEDFAKIRQAYQSSRAQIKGVTVRELAAWTWRPKTEDTSAAGSMTPAELSAFMGAIVGGLGAPPDAEAPLTEAQQPFWVTEMSKDLGRTGPTFMMLNEVLKASSTPPNSQLFEIPQNYKPAAS